MRTFQEYLKKIKPQVDERIGEICREKLKDPDIIPMLLKGKRLRAGLLLLVFDSVSKKEQNRDAALNLACAVELAHSASLILDDMLDEDTERRGLPTLHLTKSHKRAMLDTIGVLSIPYDIAAPYGKQFVGSLAQTQRSMVSGVVKELFSHPDLPATKLYEAVISQKTGRLFSLSALWGFMAARCIDCAAHPLDQYCEYKGDMAALANYGIHCGNAMQTADDIADLQIIIDGKKKDGFGSELILLRCVNVDRLVKEFFTDVKNLSVDLKKIKELWARESVQKTLREILDKEILEARTIITCTKIPYLEYEELLMSAPGEIADIMIKEL
uniref:Putative polyprenyl synthetase n=1 Tax=viral metagenome TaxID=1070528 RepID=A0A6M3IFJ8_9ZZZZ